MRRIRLIGLMGLLALPAFGAGIGPGNPPPVPMTAFARQFLSNQTATGARSLMGIADTNLHLATATNIVLWGHTTAESNFIVGSELRVSGGMRGDGFGITNLAVAGITNATSLTNATGILAITAQQTNAARIAVVGAPLTNAAGILAITAQQTNAAAVLAITAQQTNAAQIAVVGAPLTNATGILAITAQQTNAARIAVVGAPLTNAAGILAITAQQTNAAALTVVLFPSTNAAPASAAAPVLWLDIVIGGVTNKLPLYQ